MGSMINKKNTRETFLESMTANDRNNNDLVRFIKLQKEYDNLSNLYNETSKRLSTLTKDKAISMMGQQNYFSSHISNNLNADNTSDFVGCYKDESNRRIPILTNKSVSEEQCR